MNIKRDIELFRQVKEDFIADASAGKVSAGNLPSWLREHLPPEDIAPDKELGFTSIDDEAEYARQLVSIIRDPFSFSRQGIDALVRVIHGDDKLTYSQREKIMEATIAGLDEKDDLEKRIIETLKKGIRGRKNVEFMALLDTQPRD